MSDHDVEALRAKDQAAHQPFAIAPAELNEINQASRPGGGARSPKRMPGARALEFFGSPLAA